MPKEALDWFFANLFKRLFSHADVLVLVGEPLSHDTLQNWANRGYVEPKIVRGKRKYTTLEVASICLAQPLVHSFDISPRSAINAALSAILIFSRLANAKRISFEALEHQIGAYKHVIFDPDLFDGRGPMQVELDGARFLLPVGRLLTALAQKQLEMVSPGSTRRS